MTDTITKYDFSFTAFSLRVHETFLVANAKYNESNFDAVHEIGGGKTSTTKKFVSNVNKRLALLTPQQLEILAIGDRTQQQHMAFLAVCKAHHFIRDFVIEVLREKILVLDYILTEGEYISFIRRKTDSHPELETLTDLTQKKVKQVVFKILEEAGIIDDVKTKNIQPQILDPKTEKAIINDNRSWLKIFLFSDYDIQNMDV